MYSLTHPHHYCNSGEPSAYILTLYTTVYTITVIPIICSFSYLCDAVFLCCFYFNSKYYHHYLYLHCPLIFVRVLTSIGHMTPILDKYSFIKSLIKIEKSKYYFSIYLEHYHMPSTMGSLLPHPSFFYHLILRYGPWRSLCFADVNFLSLNSIFQWWEWSIVFCRNICYSLSNCHKKHQKSKKKIEKIYGETNFNLWLNVQEKKW